VRTPHPKSNFCPVAPWAHPLVKQLYEIMEDKKLSLRDVAERADVSSKAMIKWKRWRSPTLVTFEAALRATGYELMVQPIK
jgi:hypothetical protein